MAIIGALAYKYFKLNKLKTLDPAVNFKDKVILVTGASSGIGAQLAKEFNRLGAKNVIICARRIEELSKVKAECKYPNKVTVVQMDLANIDTLKDQAIELGKKYEIDILVNNGGISMRDQFHNLQLKTAEQMMNVNYLSAVCLSRYIGEEMTKRKSGQIVNVNSVAGLFPVPVRTLYSASKYAMTMFARTIRAELKDYNITVTDIFPGYVRTSISENALTGDGTSFGKVDENIGKGMAVEKAVTMMLNGIYFKHNRIMVCDAFFLAVVFV